MQTTFHSKSNYKRVKGTRLVKSTKVSIKGSRTKALSKWKRQKDLLWVLRLAHATYRSSTLTTRTKAQVGVTLLQARVVSLGVTATLIPTLLSVALIAVAVRNQP